MRVILDTNVLVSGLINPAGTPALLIHAWRDRRFILISHKRQVDEFREVSRHSRIRKYLKPSAAGRLVNQIAGLAEMPEKLPNVARSPDPFDDYLLALCEAGHADRLVTRDKNVLLSLGQHANARICRASDLVAELGLSE